MNESKNRPLIFLITGVVLMACLCSVALGIAGMAFFSVTGRQITMGPLVVTQRVVATLPPAGTAAPSLPLPTATNIPAAENPCASGRRRDSP